MVTAEKYYRGHVWIGLYADIHSWRWSLEKEGYYDEGEFRMWRSDAPNKVEYATCVAMTAGGLWNDLPCERKRPFVCYDGKKNTL